MKKVLQKSSTSKLIGAFFVWALISQASAQSAPYLADPGVMIGAKSLGLAGSTSASTLTLDSLFQNPASAAFEKRYSIGASYLGASNGLVAGVVDTQSGPVGGGAYYLRRDYRNFSSPNLALGLSKRVDETAGVALMGKVSELLGVGANLRYTYRKSYDTTQGTLSGWNFDLGLRYRAGAQLMLGLVGQNLLTDEKGIAPRKYLGAAEFYAGSGFGISGQVFHVDNRSTLSSSTLPDPSRLNGWSAGLEYRISAGLAARAGYLSNPSWLQKMATLGFGYETINFSFDYAYATSTEGARHSDHTLSVTGYF
jgi:hypothetical protein